jgi:hypothetical protein
MITCPAGGVAVRTGYRAGPGSPIDGLKEVKLKGCSHCGGEHVWDGKDGYWVEEVVEELTFWAGIRQLWRGSRHAEGGSSR